MTERHKKLTEFDFAKLWAIKPVIYKEKYYLLVQIKEDNQLVSISRPGLKNQGSIKDLQSRISFKQK